MPTGLGALVLPGATASNPAGPNAGGFLFGTVSSRTPLRVIIDGATTSLAASAAFSDLQFCGIGARVIGIRIGTTFYISNIVTPVASMPTILSQINAGSQGGVAVAANTQVILVNSAQAVPSGAQRVTINWMCTGVKWTANGAGFVYFYYTDATTSTSTLAGVVRVHNQTDAAATPSAAYTIDLPCAGLSSITARLDVSNDAGSSSALATKPLWINWTFWG
jgi:hypothetical protein